ncbi:MAG: hypothetical protein JNL70_16685 [Saprospiraceae bacterium]|nr:hypothetical protein [Saprospiraceae bacterium]
MKKIVLFFVFVTLAFASQAQTADEIVEKYFKAIGGAEKWKKLESQSATGYVVVQGMNIPFKMMQARPNLMYSEGEFQGNKFIESFDGTVAWMQNPFAGAAKPTKKDAEETKEAAKENFEDDFIDYKTKGHTIELDPKQEEMDGVKCYKITMKRKQGDEKIYFLDAENYVTVCMRTTAQSGPMKGQASETYLSDYKDVDGLLIPHTMETKVGGQTVMTLKMEKVELNSPTFDKKIFSFPE